MSKFRRGTASEVRRKSTGASSAGRKAAAATGRKAASPATKAAGPATKPAAKPGVARPEAPLAALKVSPNVAAILAIGDEILRGEIANSNAAFLSDRLFDAGYEVRAHRVVSDRVADIRAALQSLAGEASVIVATGGLGPTEDDRTVEVVCDLLGVAAVEHAPSLDAMKQRFSAHGFALTPNNLRQVRVPAGAEAFPNAAGIAPGFCVRIGGADVYFLPGIPREMESIFGAHCMPRLVARMVGHGVPKAAVRTFHVYGMGESHIDHRLVGLVESIADATVHFRTAAPENHVKVVVRTGDFAKSQAVLDQIDHELRKRIGQGVYGIDGQTFPMVVGQALREANATLALAESCTGGYAGQLITSEPGSSEFFRGGVVAYGNEVKTGVLAVPAEVLSEHGAVSEPCARAMAEGAKKLTNATIAVAITGVAGSRMDGRPVQSGGRQQGDKPVGTVCFAVAGPRPTKSSTKLFSGDRERIRRAAAYFALDMARRYFT
jgi:nicotinamide-nucleotide amidase